MKDKKFSLKSVIDESVAGFHGVSKKIILASVIQYMTFLLTYLLTKSLLVSFVVYSLFLPTQVKFLIQAKTESVESAFKVQKNLGTNLLISMFFTLAFGVSALILIFPAVIFFANYALVFDVAGREQLGVFESFKKAREEVKGYRGKMALICLIFFLILLLFVGLGMLLMWSFSLFIPALNINSNFIWSFLKIPMFYYVGMFVGASAFLIFVFPLELLCVSNIRVAIKADKEFSESVENEISEYQKNQDESHKRETEEIEKEAETNTTNDDGAGDNPSDYIF